MIISHKDLKAVIVERKTNKNTRLVKQKIPTIPKRSLLRIISKFQSLCNKLKKPNLDAFLSRK